MHRQTAVAEAAAAAAPTTELSPEQALQLAIAWHREGRWDAAGKIYEALLRVQPRDANVLHFLGMLRYQRGRRDEAIALMQQSIAEDGAVPDWHCNLGNVLLESNRLDEAAAAYARAQALAPERPELHNNLGALLREQGRLAEAEAAYRRALELKPDFADAYTNLGSLLMRTGRPEEGIRAFWEALVHSPRHGKARKLVGMAYGQLGRMEEAARVYREWLEDEPGNAEALHHLAACAGGPVPQRAADDYVETVFDGFAKSFDAKLTRLHYQAPALVAQRVAELAGAPQRALRVLDAGCGTGLCGPLLAPYARHLHGVDLSAGMLAQAEPRQVYDRLSKGELTAFIAAAPAASWELIVSADTLCYFGDLAGVAAAAAHALAPGGWLVFTVEALPEAAAEPYRLHPHGRYAHGAGYVREALAAAGLAVLGVQAAHLRTENARPVDGFLVSARKAGAAGSS